MAIRSLGDYMQEGEKRETLQLMRKESDAFSEMRKKIFAPLLTPERRKKYELFLRGLEIFGKIEKNPLKGIFLENYYAAMRLLDDIADGDVPVPAPYPSSSPYIEAKIAFIRTMECGTFQQQDEIDRLLAFCHRVGRELGHDFRMESEDILSSLLFDAKRRGTGNVFPEAELDDYFFRRDISGTIVACLKLFDENPKHYEVLKPLGDAVRIYYNLRDFSEDCTVGLVNIPLEDMAKFGITKPPETNSPGVQEWFRDQANKGLKLLQDYHRERKSIGLRPLTRAALFSAFELTTTQYLMNVARAHIGNPFNAA